MIDTIKGKLVFISHNKNDKDIAREIGLFLTSEGINVWFDEWNISAGESITEQINEGLYGCTHFIVIWSKNSARSNWVNRELNSIIGLSIAQGGEPKIIPVILDNTALPIILNDILNINYNGGKEEDRSNIIKAVTGECPSNNYIKAIVKKYHEVINDDVNLNNVLPYKACPICGSTRLIQKRLIDYINDEEYFTIKCCECSWNEYTQ